MFLPIGDEPNPRRFAVVNWFLIAANVAIWLFVSFPLSRQPFRAADPGGREYVRFLAGEVGDETELTQAVLRASRYDTFVFEHGYRPSNPSVADLVAAMFLHAGLLHLAGNMLFLWIYGDNVEARLGRLGYLAAYVGTGAAATLAHAAFDRDSPIPMVGASGAISGVLGLYFLFFPRNQVKVFIALFPFFMDVVRVPARIVLGIFVVVDNLFPLFFQRSEGGVAYGAHLGGFIAGLALAALIGRRGRAGDADDDAPQRVEDWSHRVPPAPGRRIGADDVGRLVAAGRLDAAMRLVLDLWNDDDERRRIAPDAWVAVARRFEATGQPEVALALWQRYLADRPTGPWLDRVHLAAGLLQLRLGNGTGARQHLLSALEATGDDGVGLAAREALRVAEGR